MKTYRGILYGFFETGTEGLIWTLDLRRNRRQIIAHRLTDLPRYTRVGLRSFGDSMQVWWCSRGTENTRSLAGAAGWWLKGFVSSFVNYSRYEDLIEIERGDRLIVYGPDGKILFDDIVKPDYKVGFRPYSKNRKLGQPCALGYWIHWTQKGWEPDDWAGLFMRFADQKPLRAELITKKRK